MLESTSERLIAFASALDVRALGWDMSFPVVDRMWGAFCFPDTARGIRLGPIDVQKLLSTTRRQKRTGRFASARDDIPVFFPRSERACFRLAIPLRDALSVPAQCHMAGLRCRRHGCLR